MALTSADVLAALNRIKGPDLTSNIVDLGLVSDIAIRDGVVGPLSGLWPATWIQAAMVSGLVGNPLKPLGLEMGSG